MAKNTRLFYTDETHIKMYETLTADDFKELFMAMLKYNYGDDSIIDEISNPAIKALFLSEKQHIDYNEKKWANRARISRENGAKSSGRPRKEVEDFENEF